MISTLLWKKLKGNYLSAISFEILKMIEEANGKPLIILKIFQNVETKPEMTTLASNVILIVNDCLYIKKNQVERILVFSNCLFSGTDSKNQYLVFTQTSPLKNQTENSYSKIKKVLDQYNVKYKSININSLAYSDQDLSIDRVLEMEDIGKQ